VPKIVRQAARIVAIVSDFVSGGNGGAYEMNWEGSGSVGFAVGAASAVGDFSCDCAICFRRLFVLAAATKSAA
jgi:hypothetical protein